jgi:quercetin dioxygenase-like cupin family protein
MNDTSDDHDDNTQAELNQLICQALAANDTPLPNRAGLRARLLSRAVASDRAEAGWLTVRARGGSWRSVKSGVRVKMLWEGPHSSSVLIELAPGASLPVHRHASLEEGIVLSGGFELDGKQLGPGDYHMSHAGSRHGRITSRQGVVAYLRGTSLGHTGALLGELVGGLLPGAGEPPLTIGADDGVWATIADGVESKTLCRDGEMVSRYIRLQPGARLPAQRTDGDEECMMLAGDAYFGDRLLCAGDFHLTRAGSEPAALASDNGALLFVRSRQGGESR